MVLVVRSDLGLKKGKIASQCAHAAVLCCMRASNEAAGKIKLDTWLMQGQPKIVLRIESLQEMHLLTERAEATGVIAEIVRDAGRTQVASGTETVVGLGPDRSEAIDSDDDVCARDTNPHCRDGLLPRRKQLIFVCQRGRDISQRVDYKLVFRSACVGVQLRRSRTQLQNVA
uniref:peptidyl-tRNA hydrolase n=1 Tax=Anopheles culicifacies TaxID=139723 RepID=A0A182LXF8_9DIPT